MHIHEMTEDDCRAELERMSVGRLACVRDGEPYVVPMRFSYDGTHLYGFSAPGKKIEWMRSNPRVCVEFDERTSHFQWMSIVISGRYQELPDTPDFEMARVHAHAALQKLPMWWQPALARAQEGAPLTPIFYCISITHMTGHRATPDPAETNAVDGKNAVTTRSGVIRLSIEAVLAHLSFIGGRRSTR